MASTRFGSEPAACPTAAPRPAVDGVLGAIGGTPISPIPLGELSVSLMYTSITGISSMRRIG